MGYVAFWIALAAVIIYETHCKHKETMFKLMNDIEEKTKEPVNE